MKRPLLASGLAAICACLFLYGAVSATTFNTFRCNNGAIVSINDKLASVTLKCDPPTSVVKRTVTRGLLSGYFETVEIEEWTYNLGSSRFIYYLTFENGELTRIESGGYGD
ncbi:MAG: DUF2845 domain-containing protein [Syntrophaceae bacterium]